MSRYSLNEDISNNIRELALTKQLNILIGSGCSTPAIPLMNEYSKFGDEANDHLLRRVTSVSKILTCKPHKNNKANKTEIGRKTKLTAESYLKFMECIVNLLTASNSRQVPKSVNLFTTNYDLFIEKAINELHHYKRMVFNDGANGYFERVLDSTNYNRVVAYRGLNDNYISEIPSVNLIKSHGSMNWRVVSEKVIVCDRVVEEPRVVPPTGVEGSDTFMNNYFHDMLRVFQLELDKPQSILLVIGFSFQDKHITKMFRRALQNPELKVFVFAYRDDINTLKRNIGFIDLPSNLRIIKPSDIFVKDEIQEERDGFDQQIKKTFVLDDLTEILSCNTAGNENEKTK